MNVFLWTLQALAALLYGASGIMKIFMFDKISQDVASFGALPRSAWAVLGTVELICVAGLILPGLLHTYQRFTVVAAAVLALESLVFIYVHVTYHEVPATAMSAALGLLMAFVAYGRLAISPL